MEKLNKPVVLAEAREFVRACDDMAKLTGRKPLGYETVKKLIACLEQPPESDFNDGWYCCGGIELNRAQSCPFCGDKFKETN